MINQLKLWFYQCRIRWELTCSHRRKKQIMTALRASIRQFAAEHPEASPREIQAHFGTPAQIAAACVGAMPQEELINHLYIRKWTVVSVSTALFLFLAVTFVLAATDVIGIIGNMGSYYAITFSCTITSS